MQLVKKKLTQPDNFPWVSKQASISAVVFLKKPHSQSKSPPLRAFFYSKKKKQGQIVSNEEFAKFNFRNGNFSFCLISLTPSATRMTRIDK